MSWKSTIFILAVLLGSGADGLAQETTAIVPGVAVEHFKVNRNGKYLTVELGVDLAGLDVASTGPCCSRRVWSAERIRSTCRR